MQLQLSKEELETLVELALIGHVVMDHAVEEEEDFQKYVDLTVALINQAGLQGLAHMFDQVDGNLVPNEEISQKVDDALQAFVGNALVETFGMDGDFEEDSDEIDDCCDDEGECCDEDEESECCSGKTCCDIEYN